MKASLIIAAYNIEHYIEKCLDTIVNQTLKDIEIIVVNDGSTDSTLEKIKKYSMDYRLKIINQKNKGLIEARKSGLNIASGEYVLFVDGDDWLESNAVEILYKNAKKHNSDIVLYNAYKAFDTHKVVFETFNNKLKFYSLKEVFQGNVLPPIWTKFIKLEYIKRANIILPSNISFAEDLALVVSIFLSNPTVSTEESALYNYYIRENSLTNEITPKILELNQAFNFIEDQLKEKGKFNKYKDYYYYARFTHLFESWFLKYAIKDSEYSVQLYKQYKEKAVQIRINPYIKNKFDKYPLPLKIRVFAYHQSYYLGKCYDKLRLICKRG